MPGEVCSEDTWVWSGSLQLGREGEEMIPHWNPYCDSRLGVPIPARLHCRSWWSSLACSGAAPRERAALWGQGRGVGWVVPAAFIPPATYPSSQLSPAVSSG